MPDSKVKAKDKIMIHLYKVTDNVKRYNQYSHWLNEENGQLVKGKRRHSSYHFPHESKTFDKNRNIISSGNTRYVYNKYNKLIETYSSDQLIKTWTYDENQNLLSKKDIREIPLGYNMYYKYDDRNREIESQRINYQGEILEHWFREYYDNDTIKNSKVYVRKEGAMSLKHHSERNEKGNVISYLNARGQRIKNSIEYDKMGNIIKNISKDEKGNIVHEKFYNFLNNSNKRTYRQDRFHNPDLTEININIYDQGQVIKSISHSSKDDKTMISTYNKKGNRITELRHSNIGLYKKEYEYKYDAFGNIIELRYFENDKPVLILERHIEYFTNESQ